MLTRFSRILIVDDSATSRSAVRLMMESLGYVNLDEASDGTAAIAKLERIRFELVISDWFMEPMPGIELLMKMRRSETWALIPFIMMTSRSQKDLMEVARDAGATHYLAKPFEAADLAAKIGSLPDNMPSGSRAATWSTQAFSAGLRDLTRPSTETSDKGD